MSEIINFRREVMEKKQLEPTNVISLPILNWISPCAVPAQIQDSQANILSWLLNEDVKGCALVNMPVFSHKKGHLWFAERTAMNFLTKGNVNLDTTYSILFKDQGDSRDQRPMVYPGRLVLPVTMDFSKSIFRHTPLFKFRRTADVPQMLTRDMQLVEDLSVEALPTTTDDAACIVQGPGKFEQLGVPCWEAVLDGILSELKLPFNGGVMIVDLRVSTGQLLNAFMNKRNAHNIQLFYIGLCADMVEHEWAGASAVDQDTVHANLDVVMLVPGNELQ